MHVSTAAPGPWPRVPENDADDTREAEDWLYVRIACPAEEADAVLLDLVAPLAQRLGQEGLVRQGFFIRYHEGGHHLRVRFSGAPQALSGSARALIGAAIPAYFAARWPEGAGALDEGPQGMHDPRWQPQYQAQALRPMPSYEYQRYEPEVERYGGPQGLRVSERHFAVSSAAALQVLARERAAGGSRRNAALLLLHASAEAFQLDDARRVECFEQFYLRRRALAWRTPPEQEQMEQAYVRQRASLLLLLPADLSAPTRRYRLAWEPLIEPWRRGLAGTYRALSRLQEHASLSTPPVALLSAYVHMLCNRLGIYPREETCLCYFLARVYAERLGQRQAAL